MHKIAFIVPTKDRPDDLRVMLNSLSVQTRKPEQIIVVDGGTPGIKHIVDEFNGLNLEYTRVIPPSLSRQRNVGVSMLNDQMTLVGYLDDDLELEPDAIEKMVDFWDKEPGEYGGAAFAITDAGTPNSKSLRVKQFFGLDALRRGRVLSTGWVSMLGQPDETMDVDWLCGGATVWKREVVDSFPYDEWFQGTGFMEDVDFSFNVRSRYKLSLLADAKTEHHQHPVRSDRYILLGKWQIVNRLYFVRKYQCRGLSVMKAWFGNINVVLLNLGMALIHFDKHRLYCAYGNVLGIWVSLFCKDVQLGGHLK